MNSPRPLSAAPVTSFPARPANQKWTVRSKSLPQRAPRQTAVTRRYEVRWIDRTGQIDDFIRIAPAMPIFEAGFNAFTHGALIQTVDGPVAVEDLEPGMYIETASGRHVPLRWIGSITIIPGAPHTADRPEKLFRVTADALGLARPATDVTFGPGARLLNRTPEVRAETGSEAALAPVNSFADGVSVVEITPMSPTKVYHLALDSHDVILANGVEVESFHPGSDAIYSLTSEMHELFLSLFPHITGMDGFGRMLWPRFDPLAEELAGID